MRIIDLSQPIFTGMPVFPGDPDVQIDRIHTYEKESWELRKISMGTHTGTHVDAFSHMHQGFASLDDIPLENFFGLAERVDTKQVWPKETGLLFSEAVGLEVLPRILAANPKFVGGELTEALERALLGEKIITYTGLIHLEKLPKGQKFLFYGFPLKIKGGDGSPVRALAILDDSDKSCVLK